MYTEFSFVRGLIACAMPVLVTGAMAALTGGALHGAPIYLNNANITVSLGPSMAAEPFANRTTAASLASVIDAPSAASPEFHNQSTHVWVSGGTLELVFDFGLEYDLTAVHFWNYHSEGFDVDEVDFTFRDGSMNVVGTILDFGPALGNVSGLDGSPILAETTALAFPSRVRFVTAVLSGSNGQVDFNNIGFTGDVTAPGPGPAPGPVPEPSTGLLMVLAGGVVVAMRLQFRKP